MDGYSGETFEDFNITISLFFNPPFYSGETLESSLSTTHSLPIDYYTGQWASVSVEDHPAQPISTQYYTGSWSEVTLITSVGLPLEGYSGETVTFDIDYIVNPGIPLDIETGETAECDIATTFAIYPEGYSGALFECDIATTFAIYPEGYSGETFTVVLTENLPDEFQPNTYSGQTVETFNLSTTTFLPNIGWGGQTLSVIFTDNPSPALLFNGYSGQTCILNFLQTSFQLPLNSAYTGQNIFVSGMETEENWYFITGELFEIELATSYILDSFNSHGETCSFDLDIHPSGPIGYFYGGNGSSCDFDLKIYHNALFYVVFRTSLWTQVDIGSATYFDLALDDCCGERDPKNNHLIFELSRTPRPEAVSYGNHVGMTFNLATQPRMKVEFATGSTFDLIDRSAYLELNFGQESHTLSLIWDADLRHRLCKGYFIPSGSWLVIELNDVLSEDCYVDRFYHGQTMKCILSDDIVIRLEPFLTGFNFYIDIITSPPFILNAFAGQSMTFDFPYEAKGVCYTGETLFFSFYEPPIHIYKGETLEIEISTAYGVRFDEEGCLDNEFVYQTEDGDPIPELFNPVPVELDPYYHYVKGSCF